MEISVCLVNLCKIATSVSNQTNQLVIKNQTCNFNHLVICSYPITYCFGKSYLIGTPEFNDFKVTKVCSEEAPYSICNIHGVIFFYNSLLLGFSCFCRLPVFHYRACNQNFCRGGSLSSVWVSVNSMSLAKKRRGGGLVVQIDFIYFQ